jgi:hypothetical protein
MKEASKPSDMYSHADHIACMQKHPQASKCRVRASPWRSKSLPLKTRKGNAPPRGSAPSPFCPAEPRPSALTVWSHTGTHPFVPSLRLQTRLALPFPLRPPPPPAPPLLHVVATTASSTLSCTASLPLRLLLILTTQCRLPLLAAPPLQPHHPMPSPPPTSAATAARL